MPRGIKLSEFEKGQITAYHEANKSNRKIARLMGRSLDLVNRFVKNPEEYGIIKRTGPANKLSERDKRGIFRAASNSTATCSKIKKDLGLGVSPVTIRRVISKNPNLVWRKMKKASALKEIHRQGRLEWARQNMNTDWSKVRYFWG